MQKLKLNLDGLKVESFQPGAESAGKGTVRGYEGTCSKVGTCGAASLGEETYEVFPRTLYACCV